MRAISLIIRALPVAFGLMLVTALAALTWGRIGRTVEAVGEVQVKQYRVLRPEVDGIISEILVEPGETVSAGQPIVRLLDYEFERQHLAVRQQLHEAEVKHLALARRKRQLEHEIHPLQRSRQQQQVANDALQDEVARSRSRELEIELKRSEETLRRMQELRDAGLISDEALNESRYNMLQTRERHAQSLLEQRLARERVGDAQRQSELLAAEQRGTIAELSAELRQLALLVDQLRQDLRRLDTLASAFELRSEITGVLVAEPMNELRGRRVAAGQDLGSIIDLESVHFVTYVPEAAILKVRDGQGAFVEVTGLPKRSFDVFDGIVHKVAAEPRLDGAAEEILYPVEIRLQKPWVLWEGERFYLRTGMRGEAEIAYRDDVSMLRAIYESIVGEPALAQAIETNARNQDAADRR